jgi:hypothetical protein
VDTSIPPMSAMAMGRCVSAPAPRARAGGMAPAMVEAEVMRMGRSRMGQACMMAACRSTPRSRIWLVKSTSMIEFFFAMPMSRMSPSML